MLRIVIGALGEEGYRGFRGAWTDYDRLMGCGWMGLKYYTNNN